MSINKLLIIPVDNEWIALIHTDNLFSSALRSNIPISFRKFDANRNCWLVHWTRLPIIVSSGRKIFQEVDYAALPEHWQMYAVSGKVVEPPLPKFIKPAVTPYTTLFVTEDAPDFIIKAVYSALLYRYHPDHNNGVGDAQKLQEITTAYHAICKDKKS